MRPLPMTGCQLIHDGLKRRDGGAEGDRTPDLYNAIVALSQLSYGPIFHHTKHWVALLVRPVILPGSGPLSRTFPAGKRENAPLDH